MAADMTSSTGDIKNNLSKLLRELKRMNMNVEPNIRGLLLGIPSAFLPILHAALMNYSLPLAQHFSSLGIELYGRSDLRFLEGLYKVMRDVFDYRPKISRDQFLTIGFAECKVILTVDLLKLCQKKHSELCGPVKPAGKNYSKLKNKKTPYNTFSYATVHTIAQSSGIGSVWQENTSSSPSSSVSPKPHLPLSPPASPLHASPVTNEQLTVIPEPVLELTPVSTPIKGSTALPKSQESSSFNGLVLDQWVSQAQQDKEINIISELKSCDDVEIVTVESEDKLDLEAHHEKQVPPTVAAAGDQQQTINSYVQLVDSISKRTQDMSVALSMLLNRMTLLETQVKNIQDRRDVDNNNGSTVKDTETQTDQMSPPVVAMRDASVGTSSPVTKLSCTPIKDSSPILSATQAHHKYTDYRRYLFSSPNLSPQKKVSFETPVRQRESEGEPPRTPEETRKILTKLRTRAQQTKELLNKANLTATVATTNNPLIYPVN